MTVDRATVRQRKSRSRLLWSERKFGASDSLEDVKQIESERPADPLGAVAGASNRFKTLRRYLFAPMLSVQRGSVRAEPCPGRHAPE